MSPAENPTRAEVASLRGKRRAALAHSRCTLQASHYSIFDSALYRNLEAEWLSPQEEATFHGVQMATSESKML
jgi:hypothetical protein